jgi:hypothetical protein
MRTIRVRIVPSGPAAFLANKNDRLIVADAADLATSNPIVSLPLSALRAGMVINAPITTSNGLAVQQIPSGVAIEMDFT